MNIRHPHGRFFTCLFWLLELRSPRTSPAVAKGFTAIKHQREVGTSYFDAMDAVTPTARAPVISRHHAVLDGGKALDGSLARRAAVLIVFGIHAAIASATAQVHNTHMPNDHAVPDS